jgi:hypothetical protein
MPIAINGSGTLTGLSVGGLEDGIITPAELSTGGPGWDAQSNLTNVASINAGPLAGMRNAIINGNFDIWQRGTSHSTNGYGSADRWSSSVGGSSCTMSRQPFTLGQTDVPGEPTYFCRMAVTSIAGAASVSVLNQNIEDVRTFAGQQITVSFWAKADAAKPIAVEFIQKFGFGGSPSSEVNAIGVTKITLSTAWQKVTVTATIPSLSGKTLGTNGDSAFTLNIWLDAGSDYNSRTDSLGQQSGTFDIAQVQVEPGAVATTFERRPIGMELSLCQRYYERLFFGGDGYAPGAGNIRGGAAGFATTKRASPSITLTAVNYSNASTAQAQLFGEPTTGFVHFAASTVAGVFYYDGIAIASAEL